MDKEYIVVEWYGGVFWVVEMQLDERGIGAKAIKSFKCVGDAYSLVEELKSG